MRRMVLLLFVMVLVCVFSAAGQRLVESGSRILFKDRIAELTLVVEGERVSQDRKVEVAFVDPTGAEYAPFSQWIRIEPGKKEYKLTMPTGAFLQVGGYELPWYRLRYKIGDIGGIVSLSELMGDDFDLRAASFARVVPGQPMKVRVRALNPFTDRPVKDVAVTIDLAIDVDAKDDVHVKATGRTNGDGFLAVDLRIPENIKLDGDPEITIIGQKNGSIRKIEEDLDDEEEYGTVFLTADKPLYQPGQTFNVRAMLVNRDNLVVANTDLEFSIEDGDDTLIYRQTVKTSEFGIAAISWPIPENAKLGGYRVKVDVDDNELRNDQLYFKVSRYDLPNFTVTAKPDKSFYLLNDKEAQISVTADYLFGKPVTEGTIKVVAESDRHWNYREQKYDSEEGITVEGKADVTGRFVAKVDLQKEIEELKENGWQKFKDLTFRAYFTDLTTNRTEQRKFDIRISKEPIHIYLVRDAGEHPELPLTGYISTYYADGTPAACNVEVKDKKSTVLRFKTNSIGAGKFEFAIPRTQRDESQYELQFQARDKKGNTGNFEEDFSLDDDDDALQMRVPQAIYKPGEMVEVDLLSTQRSGIVYVDVVKEWRVVDSQIVKLDGGRAHLSVPYKNSFRGDLTIVAYSDKEEGRWSRSMRAARGIIFPEQQNLLLNAIFTKKEYRPGEDATVKLSVADGSRRPAFSAIGLGIFDKAIEERARTETEFGGYFGGYYDLMGYGTSFGNITLKDLNDLDLSRPVSPEMQLAAEIMLSRNWYYPAVYHSGDNYAEARKLYSETIAKQLKPVEAALEKQFKATYEHATDSSSLQNILARNGISFADLRDPWGQPFEARFQVARTQDVLALFTTGPDKKKDTADDFHVMTSAFTYFNREGDAIDRAVREYNSRTGGYIRASQTLRTELAKQNVDLDKLTDRWGKPYQIFFETVGRELTIRFHSLGPNGIDDQNKYGGDDFDVWKNTVDHFAPSEQAISRILDDEVNVKKQPFPRDVAQFVATLRKNGLEIDSIKDGNGRPVSVTVSTKPRYSDKTTIENGVTKITPTTEEMVVFKLWSVGNDLIDGSDDKELATFSTVITEAHKGTGFAKTDVKSTVFSGALGAVEGTITDPNGAVIPGATLTATDKLDATKQFSTTTNGEGYFRLSNLPSGKYRIVAMAMGFKSTAVDDISVRSQTLIQVGFTLEVGAAGVTVDVTSDAPQTVNSSDASISTIKSSVKIRLPESRISTPRLREYFPETLLWKPEIITDQKGRAEVNFKMADNITTWKMFAIASTKKGKIGVVEKEITAFQPFFADLDPPKFLTEGDEIHLPTQIRNYTDKKQAVDVTMDRSPWFSFISSEKQRVNVAAGGSQNAVFGFKATTAISGGKQRVTAIAAGDSDAIEKPVTVRPNGEQIVRTDSRMFDSRTEMQIDFPANALPRTQKAELKIYPNLFAHVSESVEGLLERPYGCGEQTISSTYPNLMILKFVKEDSPIKQKAAKYLQKGYDRLLGYQSADGGFTYWGGKSEPDIALTAYAIRFLNDASSQIDVDETVIKRATDWLLRQQNADGTWTKKYYYETAVDTRRTVTITTYVTRVIAAINDKDTKRSDAVRRSLAFLKEKNASIDEPYSIALFGLASLDSGDTATAVEAARRLQKLAITDADSVYWKLETNTPFYGWGTAGRIETTALVLQLLIATKDADKNGFDLISKATLFLLKNKDRYGVWYSTQTTINVLDAFLAALAEKKNVGSSVVVSINGVETEHINIPSDKLDPVTLDLTGKLDANNRIQITSSGEQAMAQIVSQHYVDWRDSTSTKINAGTSSAIRLDYKCDKATAKIMEDVTCSIEAERVGFRGYGMLLAEIGTPPGADVSRESLEKAIADDWNISHYDVLPDRIVIYMWSKPGGTRFNFKFKPRYAINAQTPSSIIYDYYNPEAKGVVAPLKFAVQ